MIKLSYFEVNIIHEIFKLRYYSIKLLNCLKLLYCFCIYHLSSTQKKTKIVELIKLIKNFFGYCNKRSEIKCITYTLISFHHDLSQ